MQNKKRLNRHELAELDAELLDALRPVLTKWYKEKNTCIESLSYSSHSSLQEALHLLILEWW